MDKLRIAQLQMKVTADPAAAFDSVEKGCCRALEEKADLLALPEMFCCPYSTKSFPVFAQEEGGPRWEHCSRLARSYGIILSAGTMPERGTDGRIYNTAYVFDRTGRQIAKHRKMHLFDIDTKGGQVFHESDTLASGSSVTVFDSEFGRIGLCVCYDFRFPELVRLMALKGARLILVPAAFNMTTGPAHWNITFRSQAIYNQVFAIGTAPARDMNADYHSWGHSIAVDPWGSVIAQMDEKEDFRVSELSLSDTDSVREQLPLLKHRRTDVYTLNEV